MRRATDWLDDDGGPSVPLWYITFSDLMALLFGFFVLLFGLSTMESNRFRLLAGSLREAFRAEPRVGGGFPLDTDAAALDPGLAGPEQQLVYERVRRSVRQLDLAGAVQVLLDEQGVRLRVSSGLLFPSGSAALAREADPLLERLASVAQRSNVTVIVEGHTDDVPISSAVHPSNWELAGARAGAVVRRLAAQGVPAGRLQALGFADTRPLASNATEDGRRQNRRVEILLRTER